MKKIIALIIFHVILISCKPEKKEIIVGEIKFETFKTEEFEIIKPTKKSKAVLILFGGYGENPDDIKREFKIVDIAIQNKVAIILMDYSKKLWLEEDEKRSLSMLLQSTLEKYNLINNDIYIGGFSSGGIVSLHISNFIAGMKQSNIAPKGVFIVDSPIDLLELHKCSKKNLASGFSEVSIRESTWLISALEYKLGDPRNGISKYENYSVYTLESNHIKNLNQLKNTKIRLYTEPDIKWWKENRMNDYEDMNAYQIKKLYEGLKNNDFKSVEYIVTENKGYRDNGERHPHSWSIIDKEDLISWILTK